jgi:hypothetical protein
LQTQVGEIDAFFNGWLGGINRVFSGQGTKFEVSFNGYQDIMEALAFDVALPQFEKQQRMMAEWRGGPTDTDSFYAPLAKKPSNEEISAIITAVGNIGGKTIRNAINEGVYAPAIIPGEMVYVATCVPFFRNFNGFFTPLGIVKAMINAAPAPPPLKELALGFLNVCYGIKAVKGSSTLVCAGLEARGLDVLAPFPTGSEIMASDDGFNSEGSSGLLQGPEGAMNAIPHFVENNNFYMRFAAQEACAFLDSGIPLPGEQPGDRDNIPPPLLDGLKSLTYSDEELAEFQDKWSEIIDVLRAIWPLVKDIEPPEPEMAPYKDYAVTVFTKLTGI